MRQALWDAFAENEPLCYSSATLAPQAISAAMLRRTPVNLNQQAQDATMSLIRGALDRGINVQEVGRARAAAHCCAWCAGAHADADAAQCFVDALGPSQVWQDRLSAEFPTIKFLVCPKADSLFKIVGAASIIAKVTRDRYIEGWADAEGPLPAAPAAPGAGPGAGGEDAEPEELVRGSGYPSGECAP